MLVSNNYQIISYADIPECRDFHDVKPMEIKYRKLHWLVRRNSSFPTGNKLVFYKQIRVDVPI